MTTRQRACDRNFTMGRENGQFDILLQWPMVGVRTQCRARREGGVYPLTYGYISYMSIFGVRSI
jgi:hypothetical protein